MWPENIKLINEALINAFLLHFIRHPKLGDITKKNLSLDFIFWNRNRYLAIFFIPFEILLFIVLQESIIPCFFSSILQSTYLYSLHIKWSHVKAIFNLK